MSQIIDGRWQIERQLGEGGQAHTFVVTDINTGGTAVLKRLKNPNRLPRFEQEVAAIRLLDHPRVLRLLHADTNADRPYLVSEHCELGSLEDQESELAELSLDQLIEIFAQVIDGVAAAHQAGIVHRDLKPTNIFVRSLADIVVGDFGVCFIQTSERLTETMEAVGPRYYIAPELAEGRADEVTPRADVYSLGKVLYWLLTSKVFDREDHRRQDRLLTNYFPFDAVLHVHQLLDVMITFDKSHRLADATIVATKVAELRRLLIGRYPTLEHAPRLCRYCGVGKYRLIVNSRDRSGVFSFGFDPTNAPYPHIFTCTNCGHVQMFHPAYSDHESWLGT